MLSFSMSFACPVLQPFFSFLASSLFETQRQLTHPPVKSSTLPLRKMPVFQGVARRQTNLTLSCVIPLWDSVTAHSPSGKELILSSLEESCFSGFIVLSMFAHYPAWALFSLVLTHITLKSICVFILSVVYFYSERLPLSEVFYFIFGLFLQRKTVAIQNILSYMTSISIAKERCHLKYFILYVVYFYSERPPLYVLQPETFMKLAK